MTASRAYAIVLDYLVACPAGAAAVAATSAAVAGLAVAPAVTCTMLRAAKCPKLESRESVTMFCVQQSICASRTAIVALGAAASSHNIAYARCSIAAYQLRLYW